VQRRTEWRFELAVEHVADQRVRKSIGMVRPQCQLQESGIQRLLDAASNFGDGTARGGFHQPGRRLRTNHRRQSEHARARRTDARNAATDQGAHTAGARRLRRPAISARVRRQQLHELAHEQRISATALVQTRRELRSARLVC
jgi:hypothetical protein